MLRVITGKLSGHAVRIGTELNLHQNYPRLMRGSQDSFEGARLWYFLYVCDHHFSIAYGRPPVIHEDQSIIDHDKFLVQPGISQADLRLHSQVAVFVILTRVYNTFGPDVENTLSEDDLLRLRHFNIDLDSWRFKWQPLLEPNAYVATYPEKGVILHHNFGKLQVSSLALRGVPKHSTNELSAQRRELATVAINCAMKILQTVLNDPDVRNSVVGVPIYLHTMITYSSVFLLKVQQRWKAFELDIDPVSIRDLVTRTISLLSEAKAGKRHLSCHIASGLSKMLDRFTAWEVHDRENIPVSEPARLSNQAMQTYTTSSELNADYGAFEMYENSTSLFDEQYFPFGFSNVLSSSQFDGNN